MSVLVLAIEKPYWQDVMIKSAQLGLPITAAVVHYRDTGAPNHFFESQKPKQINGKAFYRIEDLSRQLAKDFGADSPPLDEAIIAAFRPAERDFYILTDRFSYFPKSFRYRKRLWRESIRYWLAYFAQNPTKALFHGCTPHNLADYTCFHTAKYLGIPTLLVGHTMINDYVITRRDYREMETIPANFKPGELNEHLKQSAFSDSKVLKIVVQKNDAKAGAKNVVQEKSKINLEILKRQVRRYILKAPKFTASLAMSGTYPATVRRFLKKKNYFVYKSRQQKHDELAMTPDLAQKYVYFAMHLQPERTSTPEAEVFEDHLLAINILAKALPVGWKLFVKENPRQFGKINLIKGFHQRDISDYKDFINLANVQLISQKIPSRDLLANAQIISTLSGSVGWEALRAGKPVIIFANAWYAACESAHRVESVAEAKTAIQNCQTSTPEKVQNDILRYLSFIQDKLSIGNMGTGTYLQASNLPYEEIVGKMAEKIVSELSSPLEGERDLREEQIRGG